jgi:hypothetical protein
MRLNETAIPQLSNADWRMVADAIAIGETSNGSLFGRIGERMKFALTGIETPHPPVDPKVKAIREFVAATRREQRLAEDRAAALRANGFSSDQVAALALLSIH